jgi:hypothetical protein
MRTGVLVILVAAVILSVFAIPAFVLPFFQSTGVQSLGTQYLKQCPVDWPPLLPGPNTTQLETLVAMTIRPGSTGNICVEYNSDTNNVVTASLNGIVYYESNMTAVPPSSIQLTTQPRPLTAPGAGGNSPVPVAYAIFTLNVSSSVQGFYMLSLPGLCPLMPLAIGYNQINYTDFANGWHHRNQCQIAPVFGSYVAVDNIGVAYSYVPLQDQ